MRAKVSELLADRLRSEIANGRYRSGQFLPPEAVLMEQYGVGRPSMREALRLVEADGLIRVLRGANGGVEVLEVGPDALAKRLGLYLKMKGADFADIHRARDFIDPGAVVLAAERGDPGALAAMRSCIARMASCRSGEAFAEVGADFVRALLEASGNQTLALFALMIDRLLRQEFHRFTDDVNDWDNGKAGWYANAWTEVVDLIERGHGEAAAAAWAAHRYEVDPTRRSASATEGLGGQR